MLNKINAVDTTQIEIPQDNGKNISYRGYAVSTLERVPTSDEYSKSNTGVVVGSSIAALLLALGLTCFFKGKGAEGVKKNFGERMKDGWKVLWHKGAKKAESAVEDGAKKTEAAVEAAGEKSLVWEDIIKDSRFDKEDIEVLNKLEQVEKDRIISREMLSLKDADGGTFNATELKYLAKLDEATWGKVISRNLLILC